MTTGLLMMAGLGLLGATNADLAAPTVSTTCTEPCWKNSAVLNGGAGKRGAPAPWTPQRFRFDQASALTAVWLMLLPTAGAGGSR